MLIVFEGIDGSGKTTAINFVAKYLRNALEIEPIVLNELVHCPVGHDIRKILSNESHFVDPTVELALHIAARSNHLLSVLAPLNDEVILMETYIHFTFVCQGYGHGMGVETVEYAHKIVPGLPIPDLIVYVDVPPALAVERMKGIKGLSSFEKMPVEFYERCAKGYNDTLELFMSKKVVTVANDGNLDDLESASCIEVSNFIEEQERGSVVR